MNVAPKIEENYPELNQDQRKVVGHTDGPLLVIAGPGSGKTHSRECDLRSLCRSEGIIWAAAKRRNKWPR